MERSFVVLLSARELWNR